MTAASNVKQEMERKKGEESRESEAESEGCKG